MTKQRVSLKLPWTHLLDYHKQATFTHHVSSNSTVAPPLHLSIQHGGTFISSQTNVEESIHTKSLTADLFQLKGKEKSTFTSIRTTTKECQSIKVMEKGKVKRRKTGVQIVKHAQFLKFLFSLWIHGKMVETFPS